VKTKVHTYKIGRLKFPLK